MNDSCTQLGYCGLSFSLMYMYFKPAIKAEADLGVQLLQTGTGEGNRGHKQWHVAVLSTEPAALIEEVLKEALHLHRALKVQQALPCVVLLAPTCASFLHSPRHCGTCDARLLDCLGTLSKQGSACGFHSDWAAWYSTWYLIKLTPEGVVFSFFFFFSC